jgi:hypothetical protein
MHQNNINPNALDCFEEEKKKMKELVKAEGVCELGETHAVGFAVGGFCRGSSLFGVNFRPLG